MADSVDGRENGTGELQIVARALADTVPQLVDRLSRAKPGRIYRQALELLERPLLGHVLAMTGGNQLRAARVLGLNRNTLRKRCRELKLALPRAPRQEAQKGSPVTLASSATRST
ncbi:MAG TPA: helix-turn-helix domain-containing protein [Methylomirabilota bacterium]|jgi:DNA-binding protein Fis